MKLSAQPAAPSAGRSFELPVKGEQFQLQRGSCCQAVPTCRGVDAFLLAVGTAFVVRLREGLDFDTVQGGGGHIRHCGYGLLHLLLLHLLLAKAKKGKKEGSDAMGSTEISNR